ncbi:MAG: alpha/beta hydrolase-fold protein [Novosphingobium sp.]
MPGEALRHGRSFWPAPAGGKAAVKALAFAVLAAAAHAPAAASVAGPEPAYAIERTAVLSVKAADGHDYRVMVSWPATPPPPQGWPALYVLDGEDNFAIVTQTMRRLARAGARSGAEDRLIVAIESGSLARRVFDYTPAAPGWTIPAGAPAAGLPTGGAEAFLDFLSGRLMPELARRWSIDPRRQAILGHSFGGLLTLDACLTRPGMFETGIAVSPSLWFGGDLLANLEKAYARSPRSNGRLLIAAGGDERGALGGAPATETARQLAGRLKALDPPAQVAFIDLKGQGHGGTMLAALVPALGFLSEGDRK